MTFSWLSAVVLSSERIIVVVLWHWFVLCCLDETDQHKKRALRQKVSAVLLPNHPKNYMYKSGLGCCRKTSPSDQSSISGCMKRANFIFGKECGFSNKSSMLSMRIVHASDNLIVWASAIIRNKFHNISYDIIGLNPFWRSCKTTSKQFF